MNDVIFIIGIFISLFYALLLSTKKSVTIADRILAVWMVVIALHLSNYYVYSKGYWEIYPHLIGITVPLPLLYGPLLYLYIHYSLNDETSLIRENFVHLLPAILAFLYMSRFYFFYSAEEKRLVDSGQLNDFEIFSTILVIGYLVSGIGYSIFSFRLLNRYQKLIKNNFSNTEGIELSWLRSFILAVGGIFLITVVVLTLQYLVDFTIPFNPDMIFYACIVIAILAMGYYGIRHQHIFVDTIVVESEDSSQSSYETSSLKRDEAEKIHSTLLNYMQEKKPYLEPKLTLHSLSKQLDISPNHLSQIINQYEQQNFNDFINRHRIEEFVARASKDKHLSFLALALDSGFNSKSTFNTVFKKHKGMTPSEFLTSLAKSSG